MILETGMQNFPVVVMDNFYSNPDEIREYALSLEYFPAEENRHPGKRTKPLHEIDQTFNDFCISKFLSLYYNLDNTFVQWNVQTRFQLIESYNEDPESWLNKNFIHTDGNCTLAGIVYLNYNANINAGTSMYRPVKQLGLIDTDMVIRKQFYNNEPVEQEYIEQIKYHTSQFEETLTVKNIYNRVVAYDANVFHAGSTVHVGNEARLTQVFFVHEVTAENIRTPIDRVRNYPK
jgi:hypothetical protein